MTSKVESRGVPDHCIYSGGVFLTVIISCCLHLCSVIICREYFSNVISWWYIFLVYYPVGDPGISELGCEESCVLEFLKSCDCFDPLSHIHHVFVVRVNKKTHIVNIASWLQLMYMQCYAFKICKNKPKQMFKRGVQSQCAGPWSSLAVLQYMPR